MVLAETVRGQCQVDHGQAWSSRLTCLASSRTIKCGSIRLTDILSLETCTGSPTPAGLSGTGKSHYYTVIGGVTFR